MTVLITLTTAGTDSGPFDLYSNLDGYTSAFESGVSKASLLAGYASALVPDYTTVIRVLSTGNSKNYIDIIVGDSTTTTTTLYPITSSTTTSIVGNCYTITYENDPESPIPPPPSELYVRYVDSSNVEVTEQISGDILTVDNENGTSTGVICVYGSNPPICIQDDGINPPIAISCNPYSWILGGSCTSAFNCISL